MSSPFTFNEFGISFVVPVPNPRDFSLDSLYRLGIADRSWQLLQTPTYGSEHICLRFEHGTILVQPNRIGFLHQQTHLDVPTSWILDSARRCIMCFPTLVYEGVGFSFTGHLLVPRHLGQTEVLLRQKLLSVGGWYPVEQINPLVTLNLTYPLPGRELELTLTEGGSIEHGVLHPAVIFRANLIYNVCHAEPEARATPMQTALDRYLEDVQVCRSLIQQQGQHLFGSPPSGSRKLRRIRTGRSRLYSSR